MTEPKAQFIDCSDTPVQPLNIAMESLLWQEDLQRPVAVLGAETGFATNRGKYAPKDLEEAES